MITAVKIARLLNNESQQELANLIGCQRSTYCLKENGNIPFSLEECKLISKKYNISLDVIADAELAKEKILSSLQL